MNENKHAIANIFGPFYSLKYILHPFNLDHNSKINRKQQYIRTLMLSVLINNTHRIKFILINLIKVK